MKMNPTSRLLLVLLGGAILQGCVAVAAGGAAAGASAAVDRRTTGTLVEDQSIELKAVKALNADKDIKEQAHLNVTSYNLIVLLTGEAPTDELRQRAELAAARPEGCGARTPPPSGRPLLGLGEFVKVVRCEL